MITHLFDPICFPPMAPNEETGHYIIFKGIELPVLKRHFLDFCDAALSAVKERDPQDTSTLQFMKTEFPGLIDAVYCMAMCLKTNSKKGMSAAVRYYLDHYYKPVKTEKIMIASEFFIYFFEQITLKSARSAIWAMLEAVVIDREAGKHDLPLTLILPTYERFTGIVDIGHEYKCTLEEKAKSVKSKAKRNLSTSKQKKKK